MRPSLSRRRALIAAFIAQHQKVEAFHFLASPGRLAQESQARCDARLVCEAAHRYAHPKLGPPVVGLKGPDDGLQRQAVQRVTRLIGAGGRALHGRILPLAPVPATYKTWRQTW